MIKVFFPNDSARSTKSLEGAFVVLVGIFEADLKTIVCKVCG